MIELSVPQMGEESKQAKDLVFSILTKQSPLTLMQLFNRIKDDYNVSFTYQAVRKAVDALVHQNVLAKDHRSYRINKKWILHNKAFFDKLLTQYETGKQIQNFTAKAQEDYAVYTLNNLYDLDVFWGDIMWHWLHNIKEDENQTVFCYGHYAWWILVNLGRETKLMEDYTKQGIKSYFLLMCDLPLNHYAKKIYDEVGVNFIVKDMPDIEQTTAMNFYGDTCVQVTYPQKIVDEVKKVFESYKGIEDLSMKQITRIAHLPGDFKFMMYKNPAVARNMTETYLKYFKK